MIVYRPFLEMKNTKDKAKAQQAARQIRAALAKAGIKVKVIVTEIIS
jgi:hypothetical protein